MNKILNFTCLIILLSSGALNGQEICFNGIDDDGDGAIDCLDQECITANECWTCDQGLFQIEGNNSILKFDQSSNDWVHQASLPSNSIVDATTFNPNDGHVYASALINSVHTLILIGRDGAIIQTSLMLPGSEIFKASSMDLFGNIYFANASQGIIKVDPSDSNLSYEIVSNLHFDVKDFSVNTSNGLLYGVNTNNELVVFDPFNNSITNYTLAGSINGNTSDYGATWSFNDGSFFAYNNLTGKIYSIDGSTLSSTEVKSTTANYSNNDGFNCYQSNSFIETNCSGGIDEDGDGWIDCDDPDCYNSNQCTTEICFNRIDDDGDGWIDCDDSECYNICHCLEICGNGIDDNYNGLVDEDDPQCSSSSGVQGGLESNGSLSAQISKQMFSRAYKNKEMVQAKEDGLIPIDVATDRIYGDLKNYLVRDYKDYFIAESSPEDLIDITNATEIMAVDFYDEDRRVASILASESIDGPYEHSKYICDRLDEAQLVSISNTKIAGYSLLNYELLKPNGRMEFATHFSVSKKDQTKLESHWNLTDYSDDEYLNFQIWGENLRDVVGISEGILQKINEAFDNIHFKKSNKPKLWIKHVTRKKGGIELVIQNNNKTESAICHLNLRRTESSEIEEMEFLLDLAGSKESIFFLDIDGFFDAGVSLNSQDSVSDAIYISDGAWGADSGPLSAFDNFEVLPSDIDYGIDTDTIEHLERDLTLDLDVKDYVNVYRPIKAKFTPTDLDNFNALQFDMKGEFSVEVRLILDHIVDWNDHPKFVFDSSINQRTYQFLLSHQLEKLGVSLEDITMIVFSVKPLDQDVSVGKFEIKNLRFLRIEKYPDGAIQNNLFTSNCLPNLVKDRAEIHYFSDTNAPKSLIILDAYGNKVVDRSLNSLMGENIIEIDGSSWASGYYTYSIYGSGILQNQGVFIKY